MSDLTTGEAEELTGYPCRGLWLTEIERLREVEKDSTDLHNIVKKQRSDIRKLKYILEEMFKICPCMCNTALDYDCAKCEARRILKEMNDE